MPVPVVVRRAVIAVLLLLAGAACGAWAQTSGDGGANPPSRVARLSWLYGDVGVLPAGASDWIDADVNRPLTNGDQLGSGPSARAELELGGADLRIAGNTDLGVLTLDEQIGQFELTQGTLELSVRSLADGQSYEVDTPTVALVVDQPGRFRVDIGADGRAATVTVFAGSATVYGENDAQQNVYAGRSYRFADASLALVEVSDIAGGDAFDAWCNDRDQRYTDAMTPQYVSTEVVGAEDLDDYGSWIVEPEYGEIWFPATIAVGWAPYRFGHWVWIPPWGWTWIDDAPWGFAPFHYGRWVFIRGAWGWLPGPRHMRPIYAPALVAFVGGGRHWRGTPGAAPPVGWFPLGPHDVYHPWYHVSYDYYTQLNRANLHDYGGPRALDARIRGQYDAFRRNRGMPGGDYAHWHPRGFTAVAANSFGEAGDVHRHRLKADPRRLAFAPVGIRAVPARPRLSPHVDGQGARPLPWQRASRLPRPVVMRQMPTRASFIGASQDTPRAEAVSMRPWRSHEPSPARFVPPPSHQNDAMRPGISFVGGNDTPALPPTPAGRLPAVPRFERVAPRPFANAPVPYHANGFDDARRFQPRPEPYAPFEARPHAGYPPRPMPDIRQWQRFRPPPRIERHAAPVFHRPLPRQGDARPDYRGWRHY